MQDWHDGYSTLLPEDLACMREGRGKLVYFGRIHDGDRERFVESGIPYKSSLVIIDAHDGHQLRYEAVKGREEFLGGSSTKPSAFMWDLGSGATQVMEKGKCSLTGRLM